MDIALSVAAFLFALTGIAGCIIPVLPGVVLTYAGLVCAYFCSYSTIEPSTLWLWLAVTVAVSLLDYFLPAYMTAKFGGSRAGSIGATVGVFLGLFFGGVAGIIVGPFLGAVAGELLHDSRDLAKALLVGIGSFFAFMVGTGLKFVAAVWMFILIWADTWPVFRSWLSSIF